MEFGRCAGNGSSDRVFHLPSLDQPDTCRRRLNVSRRERPTHQAVGGQPTGGCSGDTVRRGARAAAFGLGVLRELKATRFALEGQETTLLDQVFLVSGVSGAASLPRTSRPSAMPR